MPPSTLDPRTAFALVTDVAYFPRAVRTIEDLRSAGGWSGEVVLLSVGFRPPDEVLDTHRVTCREVAHVPTDGLVAALRERPIRPMPDGRHFGKLAQWDKLQVFDPWMQRWDRVVYLDAGLRVFDRVDPLLSIDWRGKLTAPDDALPGDNGKRFRCQLDLDANPTVRDRLLADFGAWILDARYFLNCLWVLDTRLIDRCSRAELEEGMNRYPISLTNEMGIMNLCFHFRHRVWQPLPERAEHGKHIFGWSERNYPGTTWRDFHFLKYPVTAT
jgi:hypothetical protein